MKAAKDYLKTSLWYKEEISDPYQVIAEFFCSSGLTSYRKNIKKVLSAATGKHIWRKHNPGDLLYEFKMLESVINAAYLLNREKKKSPIEINKESAFNPNLFCDYRASSQWGCFPKALSFKEFANPYLAFKRFFKYLSLPEWKQELRDLLEYALVETNMSEAGIEKDMLSLYFHLTKLVEAAHLIDVREVTHINGVLKNKIKAT